MFNNFKHILIGILSAVIVIAVGASAYNAFASPAAPAANTDLAQYGNGNGNGERVRLPMEEVAEFR